MLKSKLPDRSLDRNLETPSRGLSETKQVAKARGPAAARRKGAAGKASRVTTAGLLEALSGLESVSNEPQTSSSVTVDSLTGGWMELPKGVTPNGFRMGLESALEALRHQAGEPGSQSGLQAPSLESMKILQEEIDLAHYVDVFRKALRKA